MPVYVASVVTIAALANAPHCSLRTGTSDAEIRSISVMNSVSTANVIGIGFKGAGSVTPTTSQLGTSLRANKPASLENVDTAWSAPPAVPATFVHRMPLAASAGTGMIFTWQPDGQLIVPASNTLVLWNFGAATGGILYVTIEWSV